MNEDIYIVAIVALLPLCAFILTFQVNPYHALILRGILGAVAALVYAVLGGADVALTEALVGTMLAITLYAVAVRSSLVMRLGVLKEEWGHQEAAIDQVNTLSLSQLPSNQPHLQLMQDFQAVLKKHYMRLELLSFDDSQSLLQALRDRDVHAICTERSSASVHPPNAPSVATEPAVPQYHTSTRIQRLYHLLQAELDSPLTSLAYSQPDSVQLASSTSHSSYLTPTGEEQS
jgi:putative multicomponent Na+:H+ antiporter subunit B